MIAPLAALLRWLGIRRPPAPQWTPCTVGILTATRPIGARVRLTVDHPGQIGGRPARGQTFEGELIGLNSSPMSPVYAKVRLRLDDGTEPKLGLPLSHRVEVRR